MLCCARCSSVEWRGLLLSWKLWSLGLNCGVTESMCWTWCPTGNQLQCDGHIIIVMPAVQPEPVILIVIVSFVSSLQVQWMGPSALATSAQVHEHYPRARLEVLGTHVRRRCRDHSPDRDQEPSVWQSHERHSLRAHYDVFKCTSW